jgi:hypothetical protein
VPITYERDDERRRIIVTTIGDVDVEDLMTVYSTLAGELQQTVEVFRDIGDAERWLAAHTEPAPDPGESLQ